MDNATIKYYNENAHAYFNRTVSLDMSTLYEPFLKHLKRGTAVLDAGCGSGRDSLFFKKLVFRVTAFDASEEMVKLCSRLIGQDVLLTSFETLDIPGLYDGIWACASLLHVQRAKLTDVIAELARRLNPDGVFYMSFKYGNKEIWKDGRYFNYLDEGSLKEIIERIPTLK